MKKLLLLIALGCLFGVAKAQPQPAMVDSLKREIARTSDAGKKFEMLGQLSKILMTINTAEADKYGQEMTILAETSRDRRLMVKANLQNGERYSFLAGRKDNIEKAISYYNKGLGIALENKINDLIVSAYLYLSEIHRFALDNDKALSYCTQASTYADRAGNDSLKVKVKQEQGTVYLAKSVKKAALVNYLEALEISEKIKNDYLLRSSYTRLSQFYSTIEDYERAIDFLTKALAKLDKIRTGQAPYNKIQDLNQLGELYTLKKDYEMSMYYYEKALQLADSLKYSPIKAMSYRSIINNYLEAGQPEKALVYFNEHPQLKEFLERLNFGHFTGQSYGYIYMQLGKYDSAKYYYNQVAPFFEMDVNPGNQYNYFYQVGLLYSKTGEFEKSAAYMLKANEVANRTGNLQLMRLTADILDSIYYLKGDYKQSIYFGKLQTIYKDSIDKMGKETDLMKAEVDAEQDRQKRIKKEQEEIKRRKNNIQYMAIIIGIVVLFLALVVLGMFKVSTGLIKAIGFFVFLMLFEFAFLLFKKNIYSITKGEPLYDLLFMIGLAALLVPLHHWLEHRVLNYLTSHNRLTSAGHHIKNKFFGRTKQD